MRKLIVVHPEFAKRLQWVMDTHRVTKAGLARGLGISYETARRWFEGYALPEQDNLIRLSAFLRVDPGDLLFAENPTTRVKVSHPADLPAGYFVMGIMKMALGDDGEIYFEPDHSAAAPAQEGIYNRAWFDAEGIDPGRCRRLFVQGDNMQPFLWHGDTALVNLAETAIIDRKVYALAYDGQFRIARVSRLIDGTLTLTNDNPAWKDETISPEVAAKKIRIIGRVRGKRGRGGL